MRVLIALVSFVVAGPSFAQSLLVEMRDADMTCSGCPPNLKITLDGSFSTGGVQPWVQPITTNDVGATFTMPSSLLDDFAAGLTSGDTGLGLTMLIGNGGTGRVNSNDITFGTTVNNPEVIRYAPGRGRNLTGYTISSITQTLNSLVITQLNPNHYNAGASSTFYIYGTAIPPLAGDYNFNGTVDAADYGQWRNSVANFDPMPNGSGTGIFEGRAVPQDYDYWRTNFGRTVVSSSGATAAPEPCTLFLVLTMVFHPLRLRHSLCYRRPFPGRA
jgi:hypothetical protein